MGSWLNWKNRISARLRALTPKRVLIFALCLILLFLPSFFAIVYRDYVKNTSNADVFTVTLYDADGKEFSYDTGSPKLAPEDSLLWMFYHISQEMRSLQAAPEDGAKDTYIRAVTDLNGKARTLTCYFSSIASASYCVDEEGSVYSIPTSYAEAFLASPYAELFYPSAKIPTLTTIDRDTVLPTSVQWYYKNYNDDFLPAQQNSLAQTTTLYELTAVIGLSFSDPPDLCQVKVYSGDTQIYSGPMDRLSSLTPDTGNEMILSIDAVWNRETHPDAYGEVQYQFPIRIRNRSEFSIGSTSIPAGGFTTLSCTNINTLSRISYTSDIDGFTPIFQKDGDLAKALLVVPKDTPVGVYSVTITYGASTQTFEIQVTKRANPQSFSYLNTPLSDPVAGMSSAQNEWLELLHALPTPQTTDYFRGNFLNPAENGFQIGYTHGSRVRWKHDVVESVIGQELLAPDSREASVASLQGGVVIQTDTCALLGNYAVVDHGHGLRIWYGHLSDFDVEKGDILQQGQSIGKTGTGGAATGNGFLIICTVYNEIIDPSLILGKKIW